MVEASLRDDGTVSSPYEVVTYPLSPLVGPDPKNGYHYRVSLNILPFDKAFDEASADYLSFYRMRELPEMTMDLWEDETVPVPKVYLNAKRPCWLCEILINSRALPETGWLQEVDLEQVAGGFSRVLHGLAHEIQYMERFYGCSNFDEIEEIADEMSDPRWEADPNLLCSIMSVAEIINSMETSGNPRLSEARSGRELWDDISGNPELNIRYVNTWLSKLVQLTEGVNQLRNFCFTFAEIPRKKNGSMDLGPIKAYQDRIDAGEIFPRAPLNN